MFCAECGNKIPEDVEFCPYCGCRVINLDLDNRDPPNNSSNISDNISETITTEKSLDELKPVIENNIEYYIKQFDKIQKNGNSDFNWNAFQYSIFLCSYRKCNDLIKYLILSLIPFFSGCIMIILGSVTSTKYFLLIGGLLFIGGLICWLIASIWCGAVFNKKYYLQCMKILSSGDTSKYGTSTKNAAKSFFIYLLLIGFVVYTIPFLQNFNNNDYQQYAKYNTSNEQSTLGITDKETNLDNSSNVSEHTSNFSTNASSDDSYPEYNLKYSLEDYLDIWGSSRGRYELSIEKYENYYKATYSGSSGYNLYCTTEMKCIFHNNRLEFSDGTHTEYLYGEYDEEASIVEYSNEKGYIYLCSPEEIDSYYARFSDYYIDILAHEWDDYGNPTGNGPYLLLIQEPIENYASSEYVIWYSSQIRLSENDISFLSDADKRIALNEIYARHGRKFNDPELQQHFNQCSWYKGTIDPASFNENVFSATEKYNIQLLAPTSGHNVSAMKDPAGIYVEDGGVYMVTGDRDGPLTGYVEITNNIYGTYDVLVADSYKGAPSGSVETISANTPFYITSYYKGYSSTRALIFDGYDTITVADEYQNVNVYHRITDDIKKSHQLQLLKPALLRWTKVVFKSHSNYIVTEWLLNCYAAFIIGAL